MGSTNLYASVARGLVSSTECGAPSTSIASLLAAELERNPDSAEVGQVARTLRQVLELEMESKAKEEARSTLHSYARALLDTSTAAQSHDNLTLLAGLCDNELLLKLLDETLQSLNGLLLLAINAHSTSDDAFAADIRPFLLSHLPSLVNPGVNGASTAPMGETVVDITGKLLEFWKMLFSTEHWKSYSESALRAVSERLPVLLLTTSGLRSEKLATAALSVMGSLIHTCSPLLAAGSSEMIWGAIKPVLSASVHVDAVLTMWLRWINSVDTNVRPHVDVLEREEYWSLIQASLATGFSERRKYAMYLLMNSLSLIPNGHRINTRYMQLKEGPTGKTKAAWAKYSTLLEITSLSTSPNQLRDAMPDIKRLLDPSSPIPASWMVVLVALGFQSGSSSVQKTMWDFVTGLEDRRLERLFGEVEGRRFLRDILLPYSCTGSLYNVRISDPRQCEYGTKFSNFLSRLLKSLGDSAKECAMVILETLDTRADTLFPPARIFILNGLCGGVANLKFNERAYLDRLVGIARMRRAAKIKVDIAIAAVLRLMLRVDIEAVGLMPVLGCVAEVVHEKLYLFTEEYVESLAQACLDSLGRESMVSQLSAEIQDTEDLEGATTTAPTLNAMYKEVISLFILGHLDGANQSEFLKSWQNGDMLASHCHRLRVMTLLASAPNVYPRVFPSLVGSADIALKPFVNYAEGRTAPEARTFLTQYLAVLGSESRVLECLRPGLGNTKNASLVRGAWTAWDQVNSRDSTTTSGDGWRSVAELAHMCAEVGKIMDGAESDLPGLDIGELSRILTSVPIPTLGQNKHDNAEMTSGFEKYIASVFQLMQLAVDRSAPEDITAEITSSTLDTLPKFLRFMEHESILKVLAFIMSLATKAPSCLRDYEHLSERILQLWEIADVSNRADAAKVNHAFIGLVFHPTVLDITTEDTEMRSAVIETITALFDNSVGKRSIRPKMAKALREAFFASPDVVTRCNWLVDIMLQLIEMPAVAKDPDFYLEESIAAIFDELMPMRGSVEVTKTGDDNYYQLYNGDPELFSRVYTCDLLARMDPADADQAKFVNTIRQRLFEPWTKNFAGMQVYVPWKKASALQTLVLTESFVTPEQAPGFLDQLFEKCLAHEPHPRYRFQMEWIAALCVIRYPELRDQLWRYSKSVAKNNPKLMGSVIKVGLMVGRELSLEHREKFFTELVYTVLPLTSNSKAGLRHQAIAMVLELWEDATRFGFANLTGNPIFSRIYDAIVDSPFYKEHADQMEFRTFNPKKNFSFAGIFAGTYLQGGDEVETIPPSMFERAAIGAGNKPSPVSVFTEQQTQALSTASTATTILAGKVEYKASLSADLIEAASPTPLQTKAQSWDVSTLLRPDIQQSSTRLESPTSSATHEVILVASLIDKPVNLGGLSRASEIMGVSTITVSDLSLTKKPDFASTSVHSEAWLRLLEVPIPGIAEYLRKMRTEGYDIVGIEQTDSSVILGSNACVFPKKTVLVLGTERFGIPAELLGELDWCVEIPQVGVTRSMNVQTAAAVVLFEWRRQVG